MKRQRIAHLSLLKENETFTNDLDGLEYNLFDFLNGFIYAYYKSGVWNDYKRIDMQTAKRTASVMYIFLALAIVICGDGYDKIQRIYD